MIYGTVLSFQFSVFRFQLKIIKHRVTENEKRKTNNDGYNGGLS